MVRFPSGARLATFKYLAKQADGRSVSGSIDAEDQKKALEILRAQQFWVLGIERQRERVPAGTGIWQRLFYRVKPGPMALFFNGLLESVRAGISLPQAMDTARQTAPHRHLRRAAGEMVEPLRSGQTLSAQMARRPTLFPSLCTELVKAGEETGHLERMLEVCRQYLEGLHETEQAVRVATLYPKILIGLAFLVIAGFGGAMVVVRRLVPVSEEAQTIAINPATATFTFIFRSLLTLVLVVIGAVVLWRLLYLWPRFRRGFDAFKMALPGISGITKRLVYSRFAKTLATCYSAGLTIPRSVEIASDTCGNQAVRENLRRAVPALEGGVKLSEALAAVAHLPPAVAQVIVTGEQTGRMDETLTRAAAIFDREVKAGIMAMVIITGIASWAVVAAIILTGVIGFWTQYFQGILNIGG